MKKLIFALAAVALIGSASLGGSVYATDNGNHDGREKIEGPSQIRNFKDIVKKGNDLFGFRIAASLEKIHSPSEIKNFENIRRIGDSLWGHKRSSKSAMVTTEARTCVAAAITKKDASVKRALNAFTSSTNASIDARTSCQVKAIALPSAMEQQSANAQCTMNYQASAKTNLKALASARDAAWKTYKTEIKACVSADTEIKLDDGGNLENAL